MSTYPAAADGSQVHDDHGHKQSFVDRWFFSTNHKDIGTLYLLFSFTMAIIGAAFSVVIRSELAIPGLQLVDPEFFNQMTTMHALVMIFGAIMPAFVGLGNWMIPLQVGAPDMALPRMNNWSFWILPFAFIMLLGTLFLPGGAPAGGWTMYPPLMLQGGANVAFTIFAVHMMGISSIMGAINIIATVLNMRAPGMDLLKMPLFTWSWLITAFLLIAVMPVLAGAVTMLLTDKFFGTSFFNAAGGGDPVMYQHIFWFFGHPEVYIMILPAFGIVSEIIPTFSRKPLFGYQAMVYALASIAFLSFIVWAHHMFAVGMPLGGEIYFMFATMLISVPTGVKIFNWVSTMWKGSLSFETPMLWSLAFVVLFAIGGFSGLMLAIVPADFQYHDTYFVVAHFHYVLVTGALFAIIAAIYYWWPKWTGRMYSEFWGKFHFWWTIVFVNLVFFPQHFLGLAGMPRRIPDYNVVFADWNLVSSIGAFGMFVTPFLMFAILWHSKRHGALATDRVWEGAKGLEWTVPSPAPHHTFTVPPVIRDGDLAHGDITH
ncbi:cytochrome c oxidase subunit I [Luteimonas notoginsengisoli]|jgi:cytochrome c oxidase subunit I|uniref:Cytochrome c oxidase subunit 1 n=1 Tax=Luteimonas notoginsengisoli TaxID=1578200 RepID=A0ABV7UUU3_9GAMM